MFRSKQRSVVDPQAEHARPSRDRGRVGERRESPPAAAVRVLRARSRTPRSRLRLARSRSVGGDGAGALARDRPPQLRTTGRRSGRRSRRCDARSPPHVPRAVFSRYALGAELDAALARRIEAAGVDAADATAADAVMDLCDRLAFGFCFEEADSGTVEPPGISYSVHEDGSATLSPWPLAVPSLTETVTGYRSEGYPDRLDPVDPFIFITFLFIVSLRHFSCRYYAEINGRYVSGAFLSWRGFR